MELLKIATTSKKYNQVLGQLKKLGVEPDHINSTASINPTTGRLNKIYKFVFKDQEAINKVRDANIYQLNESTNWVSESSKKYEKLLYTWLF